MTFLKGHIHRVMGAEWVTGDTYPDPSVPTPAQLIQFRPTQFNEIYPRRHPYLRNYLHKGLQIPRVPLFYPITVG